MLLSSRVRCFKLAAINMAVAITATMAPYTSAQEATTFASSFAVPVFDQIDQNGVDLVTGTWRVRTPTIWVGEGEYKQERGLQWTGQAWTHIGQPTLWKDDGKYIVMYKGGSHEFNGSGSGWTKRAPIDGSSLTCAAFMGGDVVSSCTFTSRDGDVVKFDGFYSPFSNYGPKMGFSSLQNGNVGIQDVTISEVAFGSPGTGSYAAPHPSFILSRKFGYRYIGYGTPLWDFSYDDVDYFFRMGDQELKITTPNNNEIDEHYLLPKGTTQTVTDRFGNQWHYQFNGDRELVSITQPGGAGPISATYYGNHKVKSITTAAGTWNYSYTTPGDFGTTTVINPRGEETYTKYHRDHGYVTEARDALNRTITYTWNSTSRRLERVTFPEGNYVSFLYDARGNVTSKTEVSKDGASSLLSQAGYAASCSSANQANCNQPLFVIDPKGNQTDFEYTGNSPGPTKVIMPAASAGAPRATISNLYSGGVLVRSATCRTSPACAGTSDEIVTGYGYQTWFVANTAELQASYVRVPLRVLQIVKVTADGQSLITCHQYDSKGHRVGTTPPSANVTSCPSAIVGAVPVTSNPPNLEVTRSVPTFTGP